MRETVRDRVPIQRSEQHLRYVAAALAYVVAGLHLFHPELGVAKLVARLSAGPELLVYDPRPVAFVLSGAAILVGVTAAAFGVSRKPLYALGTILMVIYIVGYFAWHLTGHGGFLPGRAPLYHGIQPHETVITHLSGDLWGAAAIVSETFLIGVLALLYRREG